MAEFALAINRSGCGQRRVDEVLIVFLALRVNGFTMWRDRNRYQLTVWHTVRRMRSAQR
jgi:hypothetical protein